MSSVASVPRGTQAGRPCPLRYGDKVRVKNTSLFDGRVGIVRPTSGHPEDIWDRYVMLEPKGLDGSRSIGVMLDQIELIACVKHSYVCLGSRRHRHRPRIKFRCHTCGDVIEISQQTIRALVRGEAKRLRPSRIHRRSTRRV